MLKLKVIACDVLNREISYLGSQSPCFVDVTFLEQGLHCKPDRLKIRLQEEIDRANEGFKYNYHGLVPLYDYIVIGYGLCSGGIAGISSNTIPLVIPRAHDCITLLLGSKQSYKEYFDKNPGTYWFSAGWIERGDPPCMEKYDALLKEYTDKFGIENAQYLMETEKSWLSDYKSVAYINWKDLGNSDYYRHFTQRSAEYLNLEFCELEGDASLLSRILNGVFNEEEVLIVPPDRKVVQCFDKNIIRFE